VGGPLDLSGLRRVRDVLWPEVHAAFEPDEAWHMPERLETLMGELTPGPRRTTRTDSPPCPVPYFPYFGRVDSPPGGSRSTRFSLCMEAVLCRSTGGLIPTSSALIATSPGSSRTEPLPTNTRSVLSGRDALPFGTKEPVPYYRSEWTGRTA